MTSNIRPLPYFAPGTAELEHTLERDFVNGEDMPARVMAAQATGDPVFLAIVSADLKARRDHFHRWRAKCIGDAVSSGQFRVRFNVLDEVARAEAPTRPLCELVALATSTYEAREEKLRSFRRNSRSRLREALIALHQDPEKAKRRGVPGAFVLLSDGSLTFHANDRVAKLHGRASKQGFFLGVLDLHHSRFHDLDPENLPDSPDLPEVPEIEPQAVASDGAVAPPEHASDSPPEALGTHLATQVSAAASPPAAEGLAGIVGRRGK